MATDLRSRYRGCLLGQALGDALGFPVEGYGHEVCRAYAEAHLGPDAVLPRGRSPFAFGQVSDDSQLARELATSVVERRGFDPVDFARRIAALFAEQRVVGAGRATSAAAERLQRGIPWDAAGTPAPAAGNGGAMRAAPIGLLFPRDAARRAMAADAQAAITHRDPRARAGSIAIAEATALAVRADTPFTSWPEAIARALEPVEPTFATHVAALRDALTLEPEEAAPHLVRAGLPAEHASTWSGVSPFVVGSVLWSLYAFLRTPDDPLRCLHTAIAVGGDVDTTAAMTGAIAGAHRGEGAWPTELTRHVQDRGAWRERAWLELADRLFELALDLPGEA